MREGEGKEEERGGEGEREGGGREMYTIKEVLRRKAETDACIAYLFKFSDAKASP